MALEHHIPGVDPHMDAYVDQYRAWLTTKDSLIGTKVLDLGCGTGWCVATWIADGYKFVIGVDQQEDGFVEHPNVMYLRQDATTFRTDGQFDTVLSFEFIEHIPHYELLKVLRNVKASLKTGGYFIGSTPNGPDSPSVMKSENPYHVREWHAGELKTLLSNFFAEATVEDIGLNILGFVCRK